MDSKTLSQALATMNKESDRGCLLVGLASVDEALGKLLSAFLSTHGNSKDVEWLLDPRPGNRPLASLAVRTRMARCLGITDDETKAVIDALRGLRNKHAHGTTLFNISGNEIAPIVQSWSESGRQQIEVLLNGPEDVKGLGAMQVMHAKS